MQRRNGPVTPQTGAVGRSAVDDLSTSSLATSAPSSSSAPMDFAIVLKLDSKVKSAWTIMDAINKSLYHSTTDAILKHKPIFDKQKLILIRVDIVIQRIYDGGLTKTFKPLDGEDSFPALSSLKLDGNTVFPEWNDVVASINNLLDEIYTNIRINHNVEVIISSKSTTSTGNAHVSTNKNLYPPSVAKKSDDHNLTKTIMQNVDSLVEKLKVVAGIVWNFTVKQKMAISLVLLVLSFSSVIVFMHMEHTKQLAQLRGPNVGANQQVVFEDNKAENIVKETGEGADPLHAPSLNGATFIIPANVATFMEDPAGESPAAGAAAAAAEMASAAASAKQPRGNNMFPDRADLRRKWPHPKKPSARRL